ncbi:MAG: tRNA lysidine(34) synthetase TilS [bacterium]|nr:tRNA lysidine(34) synthetase TilS [bacterium]
MTKTIEQKALRFIDENHLIEPGDKILVALSGGADSVFLLSFLLKFKKRFRIELAAFHLNHKLRGKSADADEKFSKDFCAKNNVPFVSVSKDVKANAKQSKLSIEEAARKIRYQELQKAAVKLGCNKIATAHNASDKVETILLNLFKGAGLKGLSGIPLRRENIIRPIICISADEIRKYLHHNKITFRLDESNLESEYERNFLRNEIIPKLKRKINPHLEQKVSSTSKIISEISAFVDNEVKRLSKTAVKNIKEDLRINLKAISKRDKSFLGIFFKYVIEENFNIELSSKNINDLLNLIRSQTGKSIHLKEKVSAFRERDELVIGRKLITKKNTPVVMTIGQEVELNGKIISIEEVNRKMIKFTSNKLVEFISGDGLKEKFEIRKWKAGDKFQPFGMKGRKKISDFLSDIKTSSAEKKDHLVLTSLGKIVWVIGLRIDERFKVTPKTKKILKLTLSKK